MTPYLQVDNLTKSFGDLVLFENISFGIAEGQRIGLIAKNGTGKNHLIKIYSPERRDMIAAILCSAVTSGLIIWNKIRNIPKN